MVVEPGYSKNSLQNHVFFVKKYSVVALGSELKVCCWGRGMQNGGCEGSVKVAPETVMTDWSCGTVVEDPCFVRNLLWG